MKTIYLIRHAKSDMAFENTPDADRTLNRAGYNEAHKLSTSLKDKNISPDLVISSPAIRAISTALIFCRNLNVDPDTILIKKDLYYTTPKHYLNIIGAINNKYNVVFLFGHNPTITECAMELTDSFKGEMSPCAIVGIRSVASDWSSFISDPNELFFYDFPHT